MEPSRIQPLTPHSGRAATPTRLPLLGHFRPHIPVTEVIPEHEELGMHSQWRGCLALEDVGSLPQRGPRMLEGDVILSEPATTYRWANGMVPSSGVGEGKRSATEARLETVDATGEVVRTFEPAVQGEHQDRWPGPFHPAAAGWNWLRWNLRTAPATTFPGMNLLGARTMTPTVSLGTHGVGLPAREALERTEVVVERHPWIADVTDKDPPELEGVDDGENDDRCGCAQDPNEVLGAAGVDEIVPSGVVDAVGLPEQDQVRRALGLGELGRRVGAICVAPPVLLSITLASKPPT